MSVTESGLTVSGTYTGTSSTNYEVKITMEALTDKYIWTDDGGETWSGITSCHTTAIELSHGVKIAFLAPGGHTVGDKWEWTSHYVIPINTNEIVMINDDGRRDAIFYDENNNGIQTIVDLYGSPELGTLEPMTKSLVAMEVNNKEAHIGLGRGELEFPQWAGMIAHKQFGSNVSDAVVVESARLWSPNQFNDLCSTVEENGFIYGIEWQGKYVYKFNINSLSFEKRSDTIFTKTQAIAIHTRDTDDNKGLWVYDAGAGVQGRVYCIDLDSMDTTTFFDLENAFTDGTCDVAIGSAIVAHEPNAKITLGLSVSGNGIGASSYITAIDPDGEHFTMSRDAITDVYLENAELTFGEDGDASEFKDEIMDMIQIGTPSDTNNYLWFVTKHTIRRGDSFLYNMPVPSGLDEHPLNWAQGDYRCLASKTIDLKIGFEQKTPSASPAYNYEIPRHDTPTNDLDITINIDNILPPTSEWDDGNTNTIVIKSDPELRGYNAPINQASSYPEDCTQQMVIDTANKLLFTCSGADGNDTGQYRETFHSFHYNNIDDLDYDLTDNLVYVDSAGFECCHGPIKIDLEEKLLFTYYNDGSYPEIYTHSYNTEGEITFEYQYDLQEITNTPPYNIKDIIIDLDNKLIFLCGWNGESGVGSGINVVVMLGYDSNGTISAVQQGNFADNAMWADQDEDICDSGSSSYPVRWAQFIGIKYANDLSTAWGWVYVYDGKNANNSSDAIICKLPYFYQNGWKLLSETSSAFFADFVEATEIGQTIQASHERDNDLTARFYTQRSGVGGGILTWDDDDPGSGLCNDLENAGDETSVFAQTYRSNSNGGGDKFGMCLLQDDAKFLMTNNVLLSYDEEEDGINDFTTINKNTFDTGINSSWMVADHTSFDYPVFFALGVNGISATVLTADYTLKSSTQNLFHTNDPDYVGLMLNMHPTYSAGRIGIHYRYGDSLPDVYTIYDTMTLQIKHDAPPPSPVITSSSLSLQIPSNGVILDTMETPISDDRANGVVTDTTNNKLFFVHTELGEAKSNLSAVDLPAIHTDDTNNARIMAINDTIEADISDPHLSIEYDNLSNLHLHAGNGVGQWAKTIYSDDTFSNLEAILEAHLSIELAQETGGSSPGDFTEGLRIFYKASFIYDGYQESPLGDEAYDPLTDTNYIDITADNSSVNLTLELRNIDNLSKRISAVRIYRAVEETESGKTKAFVAYRFVEDRQLNATFELTEQDTTNPVWEIVRKVIIKDDNSVHSVSFEGSTGISEALDNTWVNYGLSTQLHNTHYVGLCYHPQIDDATNFLFKSKPYCFDQFNVAVDLLKLPTKPTALAAFNGRIFAFDENTTHKIEPNYFYIEDSFEGIGCLNQDALVVSEYGMCFADKNNIYIYDGNRPIAIGDAIVRGDDKAWQNVSTNWSPKMLFDAERNSYVALFSDGNNGYYGWAYNIMRKRWDLWEFGTDEPCSYLKGKHGEMLVCAGQKLIHWLGGNGSDNWSWTSKKMTMNTDTQIKFFKKTRVSGNNTDIIDSITTSEGAPAKSGETDGNGDYVYSLSGSDAKAKWIQYNITNESGSNTIDAIGTIFRRRGIR